VDRARSRRSAVVTAAAAYLGAACAVELAAPPFEGLKPLRRISAAGAEEGEQREGDGASDWRPAHLDKIAFQRQGG
jgi:hypothetical protein